MTIPDRPLYDQDLLDFLNGPEITSTPAFQAVLNTHTILKGTVNGAPRWAVFKLPIYRQFGALFYGDTEEESKRVVDMLAYSAAHSAMLREITGHNRSYDKTDAE